MLSAVVSLKSFSQEVVSIPRLMSNEGASSTVAAALRLVGGGDSLRGELEGVLEIGATAGGTGASCRTSEPTDGATGAV